MIDMLQSFEPFASTGVLQQILFIRRKERCLFPFGGLPITGRFYDEVIPTTESLNRKDHKGVSYIPHICRYLFLEYHKIL
ncbi:unnamed protein product [Prunus armeniaca]